jgi:hypothetical protein
MAGLLAGIVVCGVSASAEKPGKPGGDEKGFVKIFNGKDLSGWEGNSKLWKIADGMIVGDSPGIKQNEFLATRKKYGDFELRLEFRLHAGQGNSGVQFRSKRLTGSAAIEGYQADIGQSYWGVLYDEHRRRKPLARPAKELDRIFKKDDWNSYAISAVGNHVVLKVNGVTTVDYKEGDDSIAREGIIALQIHSGPAMRIDFRNIRIRDLSR